MSNYNRKINFSDVKSLEQVRVIKENFNSLI